MGEGGDRPAGSANEKGKPAPAGVPGGEQPDNGQSQLDNHTAHTGNPAPEHLLAGVYSPSSDKTERSSFIKGAMDALAPLMLDAVQGMPAVDRNEKSKYAVLNPEQAAKRQFANFPDGVPIVPGGPTKGELIADYITVTNANMRHVDYPLRMDNPRRRGLAAFTIANGNDRPCGELNEEIGLKYLPRVFERGGRLLDANSKDPAEQKKWEEEIKILAKISSLLVKDDNALWFPQQIDRYNPDPQYRPYDEPVMPPKDFSHHLPEKFVTDLFVDKDGKPRVFNPRELEEKEKLSTLAGALTQLDVEEQAVLALHREVLDQVRAWWLLADGDFIKGDMKASRDQMVKQILGTYKQEFQNFDNVLNQSGITPEKWAQCQQLALTKIPDTAQAMHFLSNADAARLTPEQKQKEFWNIRAKRQTDADIVRETIRIAEWRHLWALKEATGDNLPSPLLTRLEAVRSMTNTNHFKNPSVAEDPGRILAMKQLHIRTNMTAYPSSLFDSEDAAKQSGVHSRAEINTWVADNLKLWNENSYPTIRVYLPNNDNIEMYRFQRDALQNYSMWDCFKSNEARRAFVDRDSLVQDAFKARTRAQRQPIEQRRSAPSAEEQRNICDCTKELLQLGADPFRARVDIDPRQDPWFDVFSLYTIKRP